MKVLELDYVIPKEDVKYIFNNCHLKEENKTQTIKILNVNWEQWVKLNKRNNLTKM